MKTPICDFVKGYSDSSCTRLHMPGHKGSGVLGIEHLDITEIAGADSLYEASGIIAESEQNASELFGSRTYYSTEGSSQCIRAMLYLVMLKAKKENVRPLILATRNAHKTFHSAVALLDLDVEWIYGDKSSYLACDLSADTLAEHLDSMESMPVAVYVTSPDYLGNILDIRAISDVCRERGVLLLVDNAHGAYLRFLPRSLHPIDLGADMCCDSAHKTLPVLTGGAYLHLGDAISDELAPYVKDALLLFGSTSPSYLILQSLDAANDYLEGYGSVLASYTSLVKSLKQRLASCGFVVCGSEPLKITLAPKSYGYTGIDLAQMLEEKGMVCEFADLDFIVFMLTPELGAEGLEGLEAALLSVERREAINTCPPEFKKKSRAISIREALTSPFEVLEVEKCLGRVAAVSNVACPPAVPIVISGEIIDENAIECFKYYGIKTCKVI